MNKLRLFEKPIKCYKCGEGGGTLVKVSNGVYKHQRCPAVKRQIKSSLIIQGNRRTKDKVILSSSNRPPSKKS